jgi:hypothetical protein
MEVACYSISNGKSLNDGNAPISFAILCFRKTSCSLQQSLHHSRTRPEMLRYFGLIASSSTMHSITFPQSHENNRFTTESFGSRHTSDDGKLCYCNNPMCPPDEEEGKERVLIATPPFQRPIATQ